MWDIELAHALHEIIPYINTVFSLLTGVIITNIFWKARIYRYANATIQKTLAYQETKMKYQADELIIKNTKIKDLQGVLHLQKVSVQQMMNKLN